MITQYDDLKGVVQILVRAATLLGQQFYKEYTSLFRMQHTQFDYVRQAERSSSLRAGTYVSLCR